METDKWGRRIRAFRKLKGYTQEGLAKDIAISVSVLGEIERGTRLPSEDILLTISNVLGVTIEELAPSEDED
ncbi:helix-turn-helix domain-containing protein [Lederbergia citri]|uniref:Helix-turn-helix transcriptional regulator n=1 Tax=Lederbergia citri TaxID=2833580 RepID=A0A942TI24_9BACI|nr:helix-turn-helix transcriptional regulator [Lederbergia citri]MBS4198040.1 helix-turn-helix transcriptional regulator [Lederbergia citri]